MLFVHRRLRLSRLEFKGHIVSIDLVPVLGREPKLGHSALLRFGSNAVQSSRFHYFRGPKAQPSPLIRSRPVAAVYAHFSARCMMNRKLTDRNQLKLARFVRRHLKVGIMAHILTVCRRGADWAVRDATGEHYGQSPYISETIEAAQRLSLRNGSKVVMSPEAESLLRGKAKPSRL